MDGVVEGAGSTAPIESSEFFAVELARLTDDQEDSREMQAAPAPSAVLVIAVIAVFVSLSGVSCGLARGFIGSREIKDNEIRSHDLRND